MLKLLFAIILFTLSACDVNNEAPHTFTDEQNAVVSAMPAEQSLFMRECYKYNWQSFNGCLEEKQKYYFGYGLEHNNSSGDLAAGVALGMAAGSLSRPSTSTNTRVYVNGRK